MTAQSFLNGMRALVHRDEQEGNALFDLFSWLPSAAAAKKHFGDYYADVCHDRHDTILEATTVMSVLAGYEITENRALEMFYVADEIFWDRFDPSEEDDDETTPIPPREERLDFIRAFFKDQFNFEISFKAE